MVFFADISLFLLGLLFRAGRLGVGVTSLIALAGAALAAAPVQAQLQDLDPLPWTVNDPDQQQFTLPDKRQLMGISVDPQLRSDVRLLEDDSYLTREQASQRLMQAGADKLMQVYAMLACDDLTVEQRYRLLAIVREALVRAPRGALGISTNQGVQMQMQMQIQNNPDEPRGIKVDGFIDGLPAERVLLIGDWITQIDDKPLLRWDDLKFYVESKRPGDKVQLSVMRPKVDGDGKLILNQDKKKIYESLHVEAELGSAEALKDFRNRLHQPLDIPSRVERGRLSEVTQAMERFSPEPRLIAVRGGVKALYSMSSRKAGNPVAEDESSVDSSVDRIPAVQELLQQRRLIAQGLKQETPAMRQQWQIRLSELMMALQEPSLTKEEQVYLQRVIKRYSELMDANSN